MKPSEKQVLDNSKEEHYRTDLKLPKDILSSALTLVPLLVD